MQFKVINCPDPLFKPYVYEAARFFSRELIPNKRIRNNCHTIIKFSPKITEYGYASITGFNTRKQPRKFLIEVHPGIGARNILETLAHEMVHVKQYIMNETNDTLSKWRGKKINPEKVDYWIQPWEIDAFGRETGLLYKFAVENQLWNIFDNFKDPSLPIANIPLGWKNI